MIKIIVIVLIALLALFLLIQLVPYGRDHANPPVAQGPQWDSPQTYQLARRACLDCHSNETVWPWYTNIAPFSWLIQRDINEGRQALNFSEWGQREVETEEIAEVIQEGEMPPAQYVLVHPSARLSPAEKEALVRGLLTTFGGAASETGGESGESGEEGDD